MNGKLSPLQKAILLHLGKNRNSYGIYLKYLSQNIKLSYYSQGIPRRGRPLTPPDPCQVKEQNRIRATISRAVRLLANRNYIQRSGDLRQCHNGILRDYHGTIIKLTAGGRERVRTLSNN